MNENNNGGHVFTNGESHNHCSFVIPADVHNHHRHIKVKKEKIPSVKNQVVMLN